MCSWGENTGINIQDVSRSILLLGPCIFEECFMENVTSIKKSQGDYPEAGKVCELLPNPQWESALRPALRGNYHHYYYLGGIKQGSQKGVGWVE